MRLVLVTALVFACGLGSTVGRAAELACGTEFGAPELPVTSDVARRGRGAKPCTVADDNLLRDEREILRARAPAPAAPRRAWDRRTRLLHADLIARRFALRPNELALVAKLGFAVPARLAMPSYAHAYHEIFQSQLPVYVTADSIFHAVFASHGAVVERLERARLKPLLAQALADMHCGLPAVAADTPAETRRDLDLYLLVGRRLLAAPNETVSSAFGDATVDAEAAELVASATLAGELSTVTLFGRPRAIDFTQYGPRSHYAADEELGRYFRAAMWASRLEFNLVSRSSRSSAPGTVPDPSETPREALAALALADLATRTGADKHIAALDAAWAGLAGKREDVSVAELARLREAVGPLTAPDSFDRLKAAIGDRYRRSVRLHPMPEGSTDLPAIATLIGPRIVADAGALGPLASGAVPGRDRLGVADVAYAFGLDRAKAYLGRDLAAFPALAGQFDSVRRDMAAGPAGGEDLYSAWLAAVRALGRPADGVQPTFLGTEAGQDLRLNTLAASFGQLKHSNALVAGQPYSEFGCEIPDGYVEPVPAAYDALIAYAARGETLAAGLDPDGASGVRAHFARTGQVLRVLRAIVGDQLAGRALSPTQKRWLGMVAEMGQDRSQELTGYPPMYTGWYFDLFLGRESDGLRPADYVADYFTSQTGIAYVGATAPRIGIFAVDVGGAPRAFVGPVARAYEVFGPIGQRLTDETAKSLESRDEPWAGAYTLPAPPTPSSLQVSYDSEAREFVFNSDRALGVATVQVLDHHRVPFATLRANVKEGETRLRYAGRKIGGIYLEVGEFRDFVLGDAYGYVNGTWGKAPTY